MLLQTYSFYDMLQQLGWAGGCLPGREAWQLCPRGTRVQGMACRPGGQLLHCSLDTAGPQM